MKRPPTNIAHSVRERLKNLALAEGKDANYLYQRYAFERFYFRIGLSEHSRRFVLKGASLFALWLGPMFRMTQDTDLESNMTPDHDEIAAAFRAIASVSVPEPDGVVYDMDTLTVEEIKKQDDYKGVRVKFTARIEQARLVLQFDIGFGDSIYPGPEFAEYPTLLGGRPPKVLVYPHYTAIAEKFRAMVKLGMVNTRLKDYFDIWALAGKFQFDLSLLRAAVERTFARSKLDLPASWPSGLGEEFASDEAKVRQWNALLKKIQPPERPESLPAAVGRIRDLLAPIVFRKDDEGAWSWSPEKGHWALRP